MAEDDRRRTDQEWLDPDEPGQPLAALFQLRRGFFLSALALVLLVGSVLTGVRLASGFPTRAAAIPVGPPPADRQLLWFTKFPAPDPLTVRLRAFDWSGHQLGTLALPCLAPCSFAASPDGQRLLVYEQPANGQPPIPGILYDVRGRRIGAVTNPSAMWADDSRHLCGVRGNRPAIPDSPVSRAALEIVGAESDQSRVVSRLAGVTGSSGFAFWVLLACSVTTDRAVVAISGPEVQHDVRVVQLSTGRILYAGDDLAPGARCGCPVESLAVTPNGAVAAESLTDGTVQMRNLSTGTTVPLAGGAVPGPIVGLSWQGRRALTPAGIFDLSTGRMLWRTPASYTVSMTASRPGSDDVLLYMSQPNGFKAREVIVLGDGRQILIAVDEI